MALQLNYAANSHDRELNGDDSYRSEVWELDPEFDVEECESIRECMARADEIGRGVYFVYNTETDEWLGAILSIHGAYLYQRVGFYPHGDAGLAIAELEKVTPDEWATAAQKFA